jgi:hypothetical protein
LNNLKKNYPIIPPKLEIHQVIDIKMLTGLIDTDRELNRKLYSIFHYQKVMIIAPFENFKRKGRLKPKLIFDERIADNLIVNTKHSQLGNSFNNSSLLSDYYLGNKVLKTRHPYDKYQFTNSSNSYDAKLKNNII